MSASQIPAGIREAELERMIRVYGGLLVGLCTGMLKDSHLAQDLVQETFIRAYAKMDSLRGKQEANEKAWLCRIALNLCRDYQRSKWFRLVIRMEEPREAAQPFAAPDDRSGEVLAAVEALPGRLREAVLLYYYQDMRVADMAGVLGISKSAVSRRLEKARKQLRQSLEGWDFRE